jgi:hypothetical protein
LAKTPTPAPLALAKIDLEEKSLEVRLRLKGKAAVDLMDYLRAYQALNGPIEAEPLVQSILAALGQSRQRYVSRHRILVAPLEAFGL